ncbi:prealbumin-like fold domain-containing protein [Sinomonas halotolerans]|uniref:Prealbumin-like fold domain-containing protein n=1 Tax=Sinomonas halotolerans TaxID=1644133 RepID=A0ABU9WVX3_9MICC
MKINHRTRWGACLAVAALVMAGATSAQATLAGGTIDASDGNLIVDGAPDWANAGVDCTVPTYCGLDQPTGQTDDSFTQGTSEDTPVPVLDQGSIPPNKSDLTRFYAKIVTEANGKDYAYLAWERVQAPTGTTNMDFELNQSTQKSANNVTPVRTDGDILVKYDLSKGGTHPDISYSFWLTSLDSPKLPSGATSASTACEKNNSFPCWGKSIALTGAGIVEASINEQTVTDPIPPSNPRDLDPLTFGEAAINLTDSGIIPAGVCASIGQAYLKSRSSDSFTAALKDFVAPISVNFNKCGSIKIVKNTVGGNGTFGYGTSANLGLTGNTFSLTTVGNTANRTFADLFAGAYSFDETSMPTGWQFTSLTCANDSGKPASTWTVTGDQVTVNLVAQGAVTCTYTNTAQASLTVAKVTNPTPNTTASFGFTGPGGDTGTLKDGQSFTRSSLSPGQYVWTENDPTPTFDLTNVVCNDANSVGSVTARTATFNLEPGENVTCTFTNRQRGKIDVLKVDDDDPAVPLAGAVFTLYTDATPVGGTRGAEDTSTGVTCTTSAAGTCSFTNVVPGTYWVVETTTPAGHSTAADQQATVGAGGTVSLTFTNPREFKIIVLVCKNADNSLYPSTVTIDGQNKTSLATAPTGFTSADLCGLGGASYSPKGKGNHPGNVNIPQ